MKAIIEYTGGSFVLTLLSLVMEILVLSISLVWIFIRIKKSDKIMKSRKFEYIVLILSVVIIAMMVGGTIGYYFCMYRFI